MDAVELNRPGLTTSGRAESVRRRPAEHLRTYVLAYCGYRTSLGQPRARLELPSGVVTVVIGFADGLRLASPGQEPAGDTYSSFVSGLRTTASLGVHSGGLHGIEVTLRPLGAHRLLGMPMWHFADGPVELSDVLGPAGAVLAEQLHLANSWQDRFELLDTMFTARLDRSTPLAPEVQWALRQLRHIAGPDPIELIARQAGWSARHLRLRFREQVGIGPKAVSRVMRLQLALRLHTAGHSASRVAAQCGFHDQAHLSREFKAMTGLTLSQFTVYRGGLPAGSALDRVPHQVTSLLLPDPAQNPFSTRPRPVGALTVP